MKAIILAGGTGTRLWPMSRSHYPKQFLKLSDGHSFLQKTVLRNLNIVRKEDLFIITSQEYFHDVSEQVREIDPFLQKNLILEPNRKNTAPAIALAIHFLKVERKCSENEILFVSPADHVISPESVFTTLVKKAERLAIEKSGIVTLGIRPHRPETGYGYIKTNGVKVDAFIEKPDLKKAEQFLLEGNYFWNSGMFVFSLASMQKEFELYCPEIAHKMKEDIFAKFSTLPAVSIDYAVLEKSKNIYMIPLDLNWSDVGSWENVFEYLPKDQSNNAMMGEVIAHETTNSLILANKRLVSTIGIDNLLIIETDDVVLVAKKEDSQKVKLLVEDLKKRGRKEIHEHVTAHRPWGSYTVLEEGKRYKIKRIQVKPLQKLSLQLHYHRSEHWVIVRGTAKVTVGDKEKIIHEGESIFVPKSSIHRVENPGKVLLEIIEVQVGEYLGEDDIVRLEDVYGRIQDQEAFELLLSKTKEK